MASDPSGADASAKNSPNVDAAGVPNPPVDAGGNTGSDEPKTYTQEAYNAIKEESIARRKEIDTLKTTNVDLTGKVESLSGKVKSLGQIITGDESVDADIDPKVAQERMTEQNQKLEKALGMTLLKGSFLSEAAEMGFHDSSVVFDIIQSDSRLKTNIVTQTVDGMQEVLSDFVKKSPWAVKGDKTENDSPAPVDVKAPGTPAPTQQAATKVKEEQVADIVKKAEEVAKSKGTNAGAEFYLEQMEKLKAGV